MLYHIIRISLNRPFLAASSEAIQYELFEDSQKICDTSVDTIVSILRRFKSQHSLQNAPLVFVHGSIRAADAMMAITRHQSGDLPLIQDTNLQALDTALVEMSHAWTLAGNARKGLQNLLKDIEIKKQHAPSVASSGADSDFEIDPAFTLNEIHQHTTETIETFENENTGMGIQGDFGYNDINGSYQAFWDTTPAVNDGISIWPGSQDSFTLNDTRGVEGKDTANRFDSYMNIMSLE
jgi:hypothetical protein